MSCSSPTGLCCICPSVESSGRFSHHSSRSAGVLLPAGQWRLGSRRGLELLLPPHLGQDLLNLPLGQLRDKSKCSDTSTTSDCMKATTRLSAGHQELHHHQKTDPGARFHFSLMVKHRPSAEIQQSTQFHENMQIIQSFCVQQELQTPVSAVPRTDQRRLEVEENRHKHMLRKFSTLTILNSVEISQIEQRNCFITLCKNIYFIARLL